MPVVRGGSIYVGNSTKTAHQIWATSKGARLGFQSTNWDWSGFELDGTNNSVKFIPDPVDGNLQGDMSYGTGSVTSKYPTPINTYNHNSNQVMELDPAGGELQFSMIAREASYWHKIGPILQVQNTTQLGNDMNISEFRTYFFPNPSQYSLVSLPDTSLNPKYWYTAATNTYSYQFGFLANKSDTATTNQPATSNNNDLRFSCYIGPNNTPYSAYTYIDIVGLMNEYDKPEYINSILKHPNIGTLSHPPINRPANSITSEWRKNIANLNVRLISFWQKPNVLYYVHMLWVRPDYTAYDNVPSSSDLMTTWSGAWNNKTPILKLFIEFGISPNGGKDIFWNNNDSSEAIRKVYARGITATVPSNIHQYITGHIVASSVNRNSVTPYTIKAVSTHGTKTYKFATVQLTLSSDNDEPHNLSVNRFQKYAILNYKQEAHARNLSATNDPNNNGIHYASYLNGATQYSFQIGRKYRTNDWKLTSRATLYYVSGSMKYNGSTDIEL